MGLAVLGATAAIVLMGRRKKSQAKSNEEITVDNADADDAVDDQDNEAGVEAQTPPASVPLDGAPAAVTVANEQQRPDSSSEPLRCDVEAANECKKYGNEAMQLGDLETAVAHYSAALEHHPNHVIARKECRPSTGRAGGRSGATPCSSGSPLGLLVSSCSVLPPAPLLLQARARAPSPSRPPPSTRRSAAARRSR